MMVMATDAGIDLDLPYAQAPDALVTEIDGDAVLMNPASGAILGLNRTATAVWQGFDRPASGREVAGALLRRFATDEATCRAAVQAVVGDLVRAGLIVPARVA